VLGLAVLGLVVLGLAVLGLAVVGLAVVGLAVVGLAVVGLGDELVVLDELGDDIDEGALVLLDDELGDLRASARRIGGGELG
jgi:hypothetical protein